MRYRFLVPGVVMLTVGVVVFFGTISQAQTAIGPGGFEVYFPTENVEAVVGMTAPILVTCGLVLIGLGFRELKVSRPQ